ncbi:fibrobacter succinogenes major paralogous domain-containing protein [Bacteroidales bacterium OttesenSCG-928-M11]|nr:fibrobacter succinogenes major paralogous domain-containing protein [Bacteroidales bacterium OttesenSCG-928-M11]
MMKNRLFNIYILVCVCISFSLNAAAQVTIGSEDAPQQFSVLEIISNQNGLRLPQLSQENKDDKVALESLTQANEKVAAEGLLIFNTDADVAEFWNGSKWIAFNNSTKYENISFSPVYNTNESNTNLYIGAVFAGGTGDDLTRGTGIEYEEISAGVFHYTGAEGQSINRQVFNHASGIKVIIPETNLSTEAEGGAGTIQVLVAGTPLSSYAGKAFDIPITFLGKDLKVRVNIGCGAYTGEHYSTNSNGEAVNWLQFQCFNLGANTSQSDPFSFSDSGNRDDSKGGMFQWGRKKDGHESSSSTLYEAGPIANTDLDGDQPKEGKGKGQFIKAPNTPYDWRATQSTTIWKDSERTENDPCPEGWRIPTQSQWNSIINTSNNELSWNNQSGTIQGRIIGKALFLPVTSSRAS